VVLDVRWLHERLNLIDPHIGWTGGKASTDANFDDKTVRAVSSSRPGERDCCGRAPTGPVPGHRRKRRQKNRGGDRRRGRVLPESLEMSDPGARPSAGEPTEVDRRRGLGSPHSTSARSSVQLDRRCAASRIQVPRIDVSRHNRLLTTPSSASCTYATESTSMMPLNDFRIEVSTKPCENASDERPRLLAT